MSSLECFFLLANIIVLTLVESCGFVAGPRSIQYIIITHVLVRARDEIRTCCDLYTSSFLTCFNFIGKHNGLAFDCCRFFAFVYRIRSNRIFETAAGWLTKDGSFQLLERDLRPRFAPENDRRASPSNELITHIMFF